MSTLAHTTIGLIGAGNMGQALLKGLLASGVPAKRLQVLEANPDTRRAVENRFGLRATSLETLAKKCRVVILAVKPQDAPSVLAEFGRLVRAQPSGKILVMSIAAGLQIRALERWLGCCPLIRVMPNLGATVGSSISAMAWGRWVKPSHRALAKAICESVGEVVELPERLFDTVTAVSGSGPAYFFLIFQALRDAAVKSGVPKALAQQLVIQTAIGSTKLVDGSNGELETLIERVASKKGTTEAALRVFRQQGLSKILQAGVLAATKRSKELSWLLSKN